MKWNKPPLSVWIVACMYLAVGVIGFVFHFRELRQPDGIWIELTEFLAIVSGVFLLRGHNWARWLAIAWISFHVAISFPVVREIAVHSLLLAVIAWLLFQPKAARYFRGTRIEPV